MRATEINGERLLWYEAPKKIHVALLRGTTADTDGNISFEKEALLLDTRLKVCEITLLSMAHSVLRPLPCITAEAW